MKKFSDFAKSEVAMNGDKIKIGEVLGREVIVNSYKIGKSIYEDKQCLTLQIELDGCSRIIFTGSTVLIDQSKRFESEMPFIAKIEKVNNKFYSFA